MSQVVRLQLSICEHYLSQVSAAHLFTQQNWPKLQSVELQVGGEGFDSSENPKYLLDRVVEFAEIDRFLNKNDCARMVTQFPQLKALSRIWIESVEVIDELTRAKHLKELAVTELTDEVAIALIEKLGTRLNHLSLQLEQPSVRRDDFIALAQDKQALPNLKTLVIDSIEQILVVPSLTELIISVPHTKFDFSSIEQIPLLNRLWLNLDREDNLLCCDCIAQCKSLTSLGIECKRPITYGLRHAIKKLNELGQLHAFRLDSGFYETPVTLSLDAFGIGGSCGLRSLVMHNVSVVDSEQRAASECIKACKFLEHISIHHLRQRIYYDAEENL